MLMMMAIVMIMMMIVVMVIDHTGDYDEKKWFEYIVPLAKIKKMSRKPILLVAMVCYRCGALKHHPLSRSHCCNVQYN